MARLRAEANRVAEIVVVPDEISIPDLETGEFFDREVFAMCGFVDCFKKDSKSMTRSAPSLKRT